MSTTAARFEVVKMTQRSRFNELTRFFSKLHVAIRAILFAVVVLGAVTLLFATTLLTIALHYVYIDRTNLPDVEAFVRFDCPSIGHVYDNQGELFVELSREHRRIIQYQEIPPIVRDAILAAEDKNFFSHGGVDYSRIPRILQKVRIGTVLTRITRVGRADKAESLVMLRQGGSTITQQLVRAYYLRNLTDKENGNQLRSGVLSYVVGARSAKKLARKLEEIRLAVWVEDEMTSRFGSKQRAKEEILARYASFLYMGNGQYGFATAAEYYFGRSLKNFSVEDADKAALLAGIAKSPRYYAPNSIDADRVLHRRNQILRLMFARGSLSESAVQAAEKRPIRLVTTNDTIQEISGSGSVSQAPAVIETVFDELRLRYSGVNAEDLLQGRIQVYSTADGRLQRIANDALEHGLTMYEKRHPAAAGIIQGSVVVLKNRDAGILAEVGGRRMFKQRPNNYGDFNRVSQSDRQPGSAMKPIVYLAAFEHGPFTLASIVPDEPISVPDGNKPGGKAISNYDGKFKGLIPLRLALAESRNAVAVWIAKQIGINSILRAAQQAGIESKLQPYLTTSLGASEVTLLELANAYRSIASGTLSSPHAIRQVSRGPTVVDAAVEEHMFVEPMDSAALALLQEGLRGVVRLPTGTAHSLDGVDFPIPIMGKTGTTSQFKDALFVGSTYGTEGITVAVRIGFDDNHSLGNKETGARVALPVFREILLKAYAAKLVGSVPEFPAAMEDSIAQFLKPPELPVEVAPPELAPAKAAVEPQL